MGIAIALLGFNDLGCSDTKFNIGCKRRREYGYSYVPVVITFKTTDNVEFHILRFLSVRSVSDLYDYLKQTSVYKPPPKAVRIPMDVVTIRGISLPPLARNGLVMWQKPKDYKIPPTIKAQIIKSNKVGEGLKERLRKTLTFDCYQEKFSTLLYIEELQMQKDIRKYDMKEVEFQQDREDRRFLILEMQFFFLFLASYTQVHHLIDSSIILACAPENSAADLLAESLLDHVVKGKLFRMYAASRPWDFVPQKLKDARVVNFDSVRRDVFYPSKEELMTNYRIIVTTLVTAGRLVSADFPRNHFTHIFIDEAGHATEPECIIPVANLLNPTSGQLVLAGDPKQLGPIIRSPISQEHGLETSLLERLMTTCSSYSRNSVGGYDSKLLTKLLNNYRSHQAIIEIPKQMFYDNELNECAGDFR
ncbi:putative helicase mov-10-B.1 [Montipora capricornis]|uniref:putative helicase mov-10-B.1 n=1 Tax=Montipora capricornis TaxID=246305 RepID=UPI0035F1AA0E